jgi:hypothetical protein
MIETTPPGRVLAGSLINPGAAAQPDASFWLGRQSLILLKLPRFDLKPSHFVKAPLTLSHGN